MRGFTGRRRYRRGFRKMRRMRRSRAKFNRFATERYVQRGPSAFPNKVLIHLPYAQQLQVVCNAASVTPSKNSFRLNSLYDPDQSGTGHQPLWFDQWTPIYNNYQVFAARFRITFINVTSMTSGAVDAPIYACYNIATDTNAGSNGTLTGSSWSAITERPGVRTKLLPLANQGGGKCVMAGAVNCAKAFGVNSKRYNGDPDFASQVTTNPSRTLYLEVGAIPQFSGTTYAVSVQINIEITYWAVMWGYKVAAQS